MKRFLYPAAILSASAASVSLAGITSPAPTASAGAFPAGYALASPTAGDPTAPSQTNQQVGAGNSLAQTFITGSSSIPLGKIVILSGGKAGGVARLNLYPAPVGGNNSGADSGYVNTSFSTDLLNGGAGLEFSFNGSGGSQLLTLELTGADQITLAPNTKYALELDILDGQFSWQRSN